MVVTHVTMEWSFKSLWMILCTVILEMLTSWDSRCVNFLGDCSRCFITVWALARALTVTYRPLWPLLSFPTLPVLLNFSTIFVIIFQHGVFLPGNSLQNGLWFSITDFVEKQLSRIFDLSCTRNWIATSILVSNNFYRSFLHYSWK